MDCPLPSVDQETNAKGFGVPNHQSLLCRPCVKGNGARHGDPSHIKSRIEWGLGELGRYLGRTRSWAAPGTPRPFLGGQRVGRLVAPSNPGLAHTVLEGSGTLEMWGTGPGVA